LFLDVFRHIIRHNLYPPGGYFPSAGEFEHLGAAQALDLDAQDSFYTWRAGH
jgi:hypothetical protein